MTTFDRMEPRLPELMDDLAAARIPDYFDDLLQQTARTRQRPAWSALERWLPMGTIARPIITLPAPWRPLVLLIALALLLATAAVAFIGSRPPAIPPPFGLARNGLIVIATEAGDLATVDPATGTVAGLVTHPASEYAPWLAHDGRRLLFDRRGTGTAESLFVTGIDGTQTRELLSRPTEIQWFDWSPADDRVAVTYDVDGRRTVSIIDVASGAIAPLDLGVEPTGAVYWRPNGRELVLEGIAAADGVVTHGLYLVGADGTGLRPILPPLVSETEYMAPTLAGDGIHLAYHRWRQPDQLGRIHVVDIDSGVDRALTGETDANVNEEVPAYSPDGSLIAFERYSDDVGGGYRIVVGSSDGTGPFRALGPAHPALTNGAVVMFSPDGTQLLVNYRADSSTWLFEIASGGEQRMSWPTKVEATWQRLPT